MIPHFELTRGKERFLLFRTGEEFHIIDCDEALTKEKRYAILESGCTPAEMQEMGLSGTTIAKSDLSAVTVTGCGPQDDVIFYLGKKQLSYRFAAAYEQKKVDDFFRGIPRKQYKTRRRLRGGKGLDWRAREQDLDKLPMFRRIGMAWNALSGLVIAGILFTPRDMFPVWFWVVLAVVFSGVYLNSKFELYFAFFEYKGDSYNPKKGKVTHIGYSFMLTSLLLLVRSPYVVIGWRALIVPTLVLGVVLWLALFFLCRECKEDTFSWFLSLALVLMFAGGVVIPHVNHVLGPEPQRQTGTVVSKHSSHSRKGGTYYEIDLRLPDGDQCSVHVSEKEYEVIQAGHTMEIPVGEGFFGIEYAIDE